MMEYTKGPWEWVEDKFHGGYSGITGRDAEVLYPNCCNDGDDGAAWFEDSPSEADRNLIAAAPDMYEVLNEIISGPTSFFVSMPEHLREVAKEVLALAEGRQPE